MVLSTGTLVNKDSTSNEYTLPLGVWLERIETNSEDDFNIFPCGMYFLITESTCFDIS